MEKRKTRRRRYTGREAAQAKEDEKRRIARKSTLENARITQHNSLEEMAMALKSQDQMVEFDKMEDEYSYHEGLRYVYVVVSLYRNLF